jgi:Tfp pilus assembly protein PilF
MLKINSAAITTRRMSIFFIIGLALLIYSNTLDVPFVFDDNPNIVGNPAIKDLKYFKNIFCFDNLQLSKLFYKSSLLDLFETRVIGHLSFAVNYKIHEFYPAGYHAINLLIHIFNGVLVYLLISLTFRTPYFKRHSEEGREFNVSLSALFIALIFISHPVQTQAVTYIVQRFASLATMFYLMSIVFYVKFRLQQEDGIKCRSDKAKAIILYVISILSAVLGMKTKEIVFTLPVMIIAYEYMFLNGQKRRRFLNIIPFILTMLIIPLTLIKVNAIGDAVSIASSKDIRWWEYLFTQFRVVITYIRLLFVPINQNLDYDYPVYRTFWDIKVICSFMFHIAAIALGFYLYRKSRQSGREQLRLVAFGIVWFYVTLSVESSVIPIADVIFEHRLYLPSIGFFMALMSVVKLVRDRMKLADRGIIAIMVVIVMLLSVSAYMRNAVWKDEITLWEDVAKKSPHKARVHYNIGVLYVDISKIDNAFNEFNIALSLKPDFLDVYNSMGVVYFKQGLVDMAIEAHKKALSINPKFVKSSFNLGNIYAQQGRIKDAIVQYEDVIKTDRYYEGTYMNLAALYAKDGRIDDAIKMYKVILERYTGSHFIYLTIGSLYEMKGDIDNAIASYKAALEYNRHFYIAYKKIAGLYAKAGNVVDKEEFYEAVLKKNPDLSAMIEELKVLYK